MRYPIKDVGNAFAQLFAVTKDPLDSGQCGSVAQIYKHLAVEEIETWATYRGDPTRYEVIHVLAKGPDGQFYDGRGPVPDPTGRMLPIRFSPLVPSAYAPVLRNGTFHKQASEMGNFDLTKVIVMILDRTIGKMDTTNPHIQHLYRDEA
jgi:hypothetical protein